MSKKLTILIHASLLFGLLAPQSWGQDQRYAVPSGTAKDHKYVIRLGAHEDAAAVAARHGMTLVKSLIGSGAGIHVLSAPANQDAGRAMQSLVSDPTVRAAEADGPVLLPGQKASAAVHPASAVRPVLPIDGTPTRYYGGMAAAGYVNQPAASVIGISAAHQIATGKATVAILDTGVDFNQPVLKDSVVPGWDFVHNQPGGQDVADINQETTPILDQETTPILDQETTPILDGGSAIVLNQETTPILDQETTPILDSKKYPAYGHGTMVAGLIHLVAPRARLMPVKVFGADGTATISQIVEGIHWAVDNGADVINMSFSTRTPSDALAAAIGYADSMGVICVAAAGNDGLAEVVFPAVYSSVIDVASTNNFEVRSLFSNFGSEIELAAPGEAVVTTYPGSHYAMVWGTSFSAPLVSGGAALLVDAGRGLTPKQARSALMQAENIGQELGAGELNLLQSLQYLSKHGRD